ncbi:MAG: methyltransferase domain-containing protein [Proteobacteria bacterium]|nr:methyltransferase domain-containing protein [Pseudomonadota bacterium]
MKSTVQGKVREEVQEYYGKILSQSTDLKTNACCTSEGPKQEIKDLIKQVHEEVNSKYYGCGLILPPLLKGMKVLDLGSGAGRDVYILSNLVGEEGEVVGVDMTDEQLEVANKYIDYHTKLYGYKAPNVSFKKGYIEKLDALGLEDNYFDLVVSNCVINLSPDKDAVLKEVYRVLKPGGEFYFSDIYADRRVPEGFVNNPILYGECLSGALYQNDFLRLAKKSGFADPRVVESSRITIENDEVEQLVGHIKFDSITYRLFKIDSLESTRENYGQAICYKGTIPGSPHAFDLDNQNHFETGKITLVCKNSQLMLVASRLAEHFEYFGTGETHFGLFPDSAPETETAIQENPTPTASSSCC